MLRQLIDRLDFTTALKLAASNDLLPPREDDKVSGELGKRFVEFLRKQVDDDCYEPDPASFIQVPKPGFTSRPAALLTLTDRVVYEALVALLRPRLSKYLITDDVVLWPRETYVKTRWEDFENAPLIDGVAHIVQADVSGFYESIDHYQLENGLVQATGERDVAISLRHFLSRVMAARRGIPQGLLPSDTLATTYLQPVDAAMLRNGFDYWRHGDDMRIACENISRAREAISILEDELRRQGLLLNSSKVTITTKEHYERALQEGSRSIQMLKKQLFEQNVSQIKSDNKQLATAMERAQLDEQWGWDLFYHQKVSVEEVIEQIRGHLEPDDIQVSKLAFFEAFRRAPGNKDALTREQFHFLVTRSLIQLAAARSPAALENSASIAARFSEKTEIVCHYLLALIKSHPNDVVFSAEDVVASSVFTTPWQQAWLFRVLEAGASYVSPATVSLLTKLASNQGVHWLTRVEAMKVLARNKQIDRELVTRSWNLAPRPYRCDLIAVAARVSDTEQWAKKFLQASRLDPVEQVVAKHYLTSSKETGEQGLNACQ